jgi:hypothetical protein
MSSRTVYVSTDVDGDFEWTRPMFGVVLGIALELGTLTTPDIAITDDTYERDLLVLTGATTDAVYQPSMVLTDSDGADTATLAPAVVMGSLKVVVAGGGSLKTGRIHLLLET